jgi:S-methylmethionine-dependent homocysteine/selenocysteine methylase
MRPRLYGGPMGTELARRGFAVCGPRWSAAANLDAPDLVAAIHRDYVAAGAEIVTANTTCAHVHDVGADRDRICAAAIALARRAGVTVAASVAMLPSSIDPAARATEYRAAAAALRGADILLLEGFVDAAELRLALAATRAWHGPRWAALAGPGARHLPELVEATLAEGVALLAVHCCSLAEARQALVAARIVAPQAPLGAYPSPALDQDDHDFAQDLAELATSAGLAWVGSCCGSTPATTVALALALPR